MPDLISLFEPEVFKKQFFLSLAGTAKSKIMILRSKEKQSQAKDTFLSNDNGDQSKLLTSSV